MSTQNSNIMQTPEELLETYTGVYYIKSEEGKDILYHTYSSQIVMNETETKSSPLFSKEWKTIASKLVKKDSKYKTMFEQAILQTKSFLDGISNQCDYTIPWINKQGEINMLSHKLQIIEKAKDGRAYLTIGHVINKTMKKKQTQELKQLKKQNIMLKELNDQALELNSLLAFSLDLSLFPDADYITINETFKITLGLNNDGEDHIFLKDFINTQSMDLEGSSSMKELLSNLKLLIDNKKREFTDILVKQIHQKNGEVLYLKYSARISKHDNNKTIKIHGYVTNNTDEVCTQKRNHALNKENKELQISQRLAVKSGRVLIWYQNSEEANHEKLFFANDLFFEKLGIKKYPGSRFLLNDFNSSIITDDEDGKSLYQTYMNINKEIMLGKSNGYNKVLVKHQNIITKEVFYFEHNLIVEERFENGAVKTRGGYLTDVTKETEYRLKIEYLVNYDTVTNLYNRHYFETYINQELPDSYTVIVIDIDGLKFINDAFGHIPGDKAIHLLSEIIKETFQDDAALFRIGGDEFVVITTDVIPNSIKDKIKKTHEDIAIKAKKNVLLFSASLGYEIVLNHQTSFDDAFASAENIMYRNKLSKRKDRKTNSINQVLEILYDITDESHKKYERLKSHAKEVLKSLNYNRSQELEEMDTVCKLHNIGKITLPKELLKNTKELSSDQEKVLQSHAESGYKIVKNLIDSDTITQAVLHHHENYDGSGYPMGLKHEDIPLFSRVILVLETYDNYIHIDKLSPSKANDSLKRLSGTKLDPEIVHTFIKTLK